VTPLILPKGFFAAAAAVQGDTGLREFVARLPAGAVRLVAMPSATCDVDTPGDLARARAHRTSR
jgi:CTP:molybdopterin cytidylyltransferase MocA